MSQRELATLLGWDRATVGRWESGHVSPALGRVDGVLRGMGFRLAVVVSHPEDWAEVEAPPEHIADRAFRHLPAHLDQEVLEQPPLDWRLRHRESPTDGSQLDLHQARLAVGPCGPAGRERAAGSRDGWTPVRTSPDEVWRRDG